MMRRLTSFITAFLLAFTLVAVSGCGKRGELRLPDEQSQKRAFMGTNAWMSLAITTARCMLSKFR